MRRMNALMQRAFEHMRRLLAANPSVRNYELAATLGVTEHTVGRWRRELGLPTKRATTMSSAEERDGAVDRVRAGESIRQVALDLGRQESTVFQWCRNAGVKSTHKWREKRNAAA